MDAFPFTTEEWSRVQEATRCVVNAILADDDVLRASYFEELRLLLHALRTKYGDHPVLLETEADFSDLPSEAYSLYLRAIKTAVEYRLPSYTIRMALAGLLLHDLNEPGKALFELEACNSELLALGEESEKKNWIDLVAECEQRTRHAR